MKTFLLLLVAAVVGAVGFHAWYLSTDRSARCTWDRRLGVTRSDACALAEPALYDRAARARLDDLVDDVAR